MSATPAWAQHALDRGLSAGHKLRMDCACGEGRTLLVTHAGAELRGYCFRGKAALFHKLELSISERIALHIDRSNEEVEAARTLELPGAVGDRLYHPHDWPAQARIWLYEAHLNDDDIREWGMYWLPRMQRVVVPLNGGEAWVARAVSPAQTPKYLFPADFRRNSGVWFAGENEVVVCEDALSAYRVNAVTGYKTVALMGTSASREVLHSLVYDHKRGMLLTLWLDGDRWGRQGSNVIRYALAQYDIPARRIYTVKDPKALLDAEILTTLSKEDL